MTTTRALADQVQSELEHLGFACRQEAEGLASWGEPGAADHWRLAIEGMPESAFAVELLAFDPDAFPHRASEGLNAGFDDVFERREARADGFEAVVVEGTLEDDTETRAYVQWLLDDRAHRAVVRVAKSDSLFDDDGAPLVPTWEDFEPALWRALGLGVPADWCDTLDLEHAALPSRTPPGRRALR